MKNQLVVMATGLGKTICFAQLPEALNLNKKTVVLAHRDELLKQAQAKISKINKNLAVCIEQGPKRAPRYADVIVASVATLGRNGSPRIRRFNSEDFGLLITDEAHHSIAKSYQNVYKHFEGILHVGFTATPMRGDGAGLGAVYQEIVFERDLRWGIEYGYLVEPIGYSVDSSADISRVSTYQGDLKTKELAEAVDTDPRNQLILDAYHHLCPSKKTLVFTVNVEHAHHLAEIFNRSGVPSAAVSGKTPPDERAAAVKAFSNGGLKALMNCAVFTEGFDEPGVEAVIMAKPTKSPVAYTQMIGRGTRLYPGKDYVTIIDIADNAGRHNLINLSSLFGLPAGFRLKGRRVLKTKKKIDEILEDLQSGEAAEVSRKLEALKVSNYEDFAKLVKKISLIAEPPQRDPAIAKVSKFFWLPAPGGGQRLSLRDREHMEITENLLGQFVVNHVGEDRRQEIVAATNRDAAVRIADAWVRQNKSKSIGGINATARWRQDKPTEKQIATLAKFGIIHRPEITKGEASALIDQKIASFKKRRG